MLMLMLMDMTYNCDAFQWKNYFPIKNKTGWMAIAIDHEPKLMRHIVSVLHQEEGGIGKSIRAA